MSWEPKKIDVPAVSLVLLIGFILFVSWVITWE